MNMASLMFLVVTFASVYYAETIRADWMSCGGAMLVDRGWSPKMFFEPVLKCPTSLSNTFLRAVDLRALVFVQDPTIVVWCPCLWVP